MSRQILFEQDSEAGQVWTPEPIASKMVDLSARFMSKSFKTILDPAVGPTTFLRALHNKRLLSSEHRVLAYDIDKKFVNLSKRFLEENRINGEVKFGDYLLEKKVDKADFIIMNPPYVRHERISQESKLNYLEFIQDKLGVRVNGRSNLYVYFLLKSIVDLERNGILCAIIYDAIKHSSYGQEALNIIKRYCEILRMEDVAMPFNNVLVDASILILRKKSIEGKMPNEHKEQEKRLPRNFVHLSELVDIKRGTGLLNSNIFMATPQDRFREFSTPFIKKSIKIGGIVVNKRHDEKAYLFDNDSMLPKSLINWLEEKVESMIENGCREGLVNLLNIKRKYPQRWFLHPVVRGKIIFNYYIRSTPRHYFNPYNLPIADNFYAISPKGFDSSCAWFLLNSSHYKDAIMRAGRPQGNGLHKVQVYEYKSAVVPDWRCLGSRELFRLREIALKCIKDRYSLEGITEISNEFIKNNLKV
jgi:hypothetical protein